MLAKKSLPLSSMTMKAGKFLHRHVQIDIDHIAVQL
jgi:hypothetical protein